MALLVFLLSQPRVATAVSPSVPIKKLKLRAWGTSEGLPQSTVQAIAQTRDGYLWLGTEKGLVRFDGVNLKVFDRATSPSLPSAFIRALATGADGGLWVGTNSGGLLKMEAGSFTAVPAGDEVGEQVNALFFDSRGGLWVGTELGLAELRNGKLVAVDGIAERSAAGVAAIGEMADGRLLVAQRDRLTMLEAGRLVPFPVPPELAGSAVHSILRTRDGALWLASDKGLLRTSSQGRNFFGRKDSPMGGACLVEDAEGSVWLGTDGHGLVRVSAGRLETFTTQDGLSDDFVAAVFEDREGSLWVGTFGGGVNQLREVPFGVLSTREGLSANLVSCIHEDRRGIIWIGTRGAGLNRVEHGRITVLTVRDGLPSDNIWSLGEARDRSLWIGTGAGSLARLQAGHLVTVGAYDGVANGGVRVILGTPDGSVWVGADRSLARYRDGRFTYFGKTDGLPGQSVWCLAEDATGTLWVGMAGGGLARFDGKRFWPLATAHGLVDVTVAALAVDEVGVWVGTLGGALALVRDGRARTLARADFNGAEEILQIVDDRQGDLWLTSSRGVRRLAKRKLVSFIDGAGSPLTPRLYSTADGMSSAECNGGSQPAGGRTRDGRLWFPTAKGVAIFDPSCKPSIALPPNVLIEGVSVGGRTFGVSGSFILPEDSPRLEIHYTAPAFRAPERVVFRYRLEGFDSDWIDAGPQRSVTFTNLAPGSYRLIVEAREEDGPWSDSRGVLLFVVPRPFWRSWWFIAASVLGVLILGVTGLWLRLQRERVRQLQLERLVEERTRQLLNSRSSFERVVTALAAAIEAKDPTTQGHVERSSRLATALGAHLGLAGERLELLRYAAILHDVGKIGVAESILNKTAGLTADERRLVERHVGIGVDIIKNVDILVPAIPFIRYHQERWDGRKDVAYPGYFGLRGEEIPLEARIISVIDAFDAMTHDRPYRRALSREAAIAELQREAGAQFDPEVVDVLVRLLREGKLLGPDPDSELDP